MSLAETLADSRRFALLYGTTPPRADAPTERVLGAATRLAERVAGLPLDGLVVYDVQDESSRTDEPRPFPYLPTIDSPVYAKLLQQLTGKPAITYKCVVNQTEESWPGWLDSASEQYDLRYLTPVGLASSKGAHSAIHLSRATQIAAEHRAGFILGGVAIAERHTPARSESRRLIQKAAHGCRFFISQFAYDPEPSIRLMADYVRECAELGLEPRRIFLTFTPCGRPQTLRFIRWLGVTVPEHTASAILDDAAPLSRSIAVCRDILRAILDQPYADQLPLGINIESVSINKEEIGATIDLLHTLREVARERGLAVGE
ncbi:MAG: hypothetical protein HGA45_39235 [Chloroflexales bacterium]|nr:hypothetical protein [Chloroflexales bacterium]